MKKCNNCGNENLMVSKKESGVIKGANYVACTECGNIMLLINDTLLPTPNDNSPQTKLLIQDAADCFDSLMVMGAASLDGKTTPVDIQPSQTLDGLQDYVNSQLNEALNDEVEEDEEEYEDICDCEICNCNLEEEPLFEKDVYEGDRDLSVAIAQDVYNQEGDDYLVILPSGEKQVYMDTSKDFIVNIVNNIGSHVRLFKISEVELKKEVRYNF